MKVVIRPAVPEDVEAFAPLIRDADRIEVEASHDMTPREALEYALGLSTVAWSAWVDDHPVCMFGVAPLSILEGRGTPWMLGTEGVTTWPLVFLRRCKQCVKAMRAVYPTLENFVHDDNELAKRWLSWMGFEVSEPVPFGRRGEMFRYFRLG